MIGFVKNNWTAIHVFIGLIQLFFFVKSIRMFLFWNDLYNTAMEALEASKDMGALANRKIDEANQKIDDYNERIRQADSLIQSNRSFTESLDEKIVDINKDL